MRIYKMKTIRKSGPFIFGYTYLRLCITVLPVELMACESFAIATS